MPQDLGAEWKSKTWVISKSITGVGQYVVEFQYQHGASRHDFKNIALLKGNDVIAHDDHAGYSGKENFKNIYRLKVDAFDPTAIYSLRAELKPDGSTDSSGEISIRKE